MSVHHDLNFTILTDGIDTTKATAAWSVIEGACGIISACLPTLRPLLAKISTRFAMISGSSPTPRRSASKFTAPDIITIGGSFGGTTSVTAKKGSKILGGHPRHDMGEESDEYPLNERIHVKQTLDILESTVGSSDRPEPNVAVH